MPLPAQIFARLPRAHYQMGAWQFPENGLDSARRACRPRLAARLCALHRKQGDQELVPFGYPSRIRKWKGQAIADFSRSVLSETAGAGVPGLIERPA